MTRPMSILLVSSQPEFTETVSSGLESTGEFTVDTTSVQAARERLQAGNYDCIVSEYPIPDADDEAVLDTVTGNVPVVLYTSGSSAAAAAAAGKAGVTHLQQREDHTELARTIEQVEHPEQGGGQPRQQELRQYKRIVEYVNDVATIITPAGEITYVSPAVERVLGYEPEELVGEVGFNYQSQAGREAVADAIEDILANPSETQTIQTKFRRADGSWAWIESTLKNRVDDEIINGIVVSSRDVTERVEQTRRSEEREQQVSRLHGATRELLGSETPAAVAEAASQTAVEILDLPLNGIHFYDEAAGGLEPAAVSERSEALFEGVPVIDEGIAWQAYQTGNERIFNDLSEAEEVYNTDSLVQGEICLPLGRYGVFIISATEADAFEETDIELARILAANTQAALDRIHNEQKIRRREAELQKQNERLEEFARIVSHDLRNPLNVAQLRAGLLAEECTSEHLPAIERSLERMDELISDTLTLARQGETVAETEPIALADLVENCWQTISTASASVTVTDGMTLQGDRSRLRHVFENLFRNAIEHGGEAVTIRVGRLGDEGLYVEDTGPGIPEDRREEVFSPGESTTHRGTGFGLTIVKRIAEAHGWEVSVGEGADGGARFEFTGVELADASESD